MVLSNRQGPHVGIGSRAWRRLPGKPELAGGLATFHWNTAAEKALLLPVPAEAYGMSRVGLSQQQAHEHNADCAYPPELNMHYFSPAMFGRDCVVK